MECFGKLFDFIGFLSHKMVDTFELEVSDFNDCWDCELVDEDLDEFLAVVAVPVLTELFVFFVLFYSCYFGVFLDESQKDSGGPFFGMEIEKLWGAFGLRFVNVVVEIWV